MNQHDPNQAGTTMIIFALIMVYFLLYLGKMFVSLFECIGCL